MYTDQKEVHDNAIGEAIGGAISSLSSVFQNIGHGKRVDAESDAAAKQALISIVAGRQAAESRQKQMIIIGVIAGFLLLILIVGLVIYKRRNR